MGYDTQNDHHNSKILGFLSYWLQPLTSKWSWVQAHVQEVYGTNFLAWRSTVYMKTSFNEMVLQIYKS